MSKSSLDVANDNLPNLVNLLISDLMSMIYNRHQENRLYPGHGAGQEADNWSPVKWKSIWLQRKTR